MARKNAEGEKINKLRKSYENYIKDIAGRDKIRRENGELRNLIAVPEEDWQNTHVSGKELSQGLSQEMLSNLAKATRVEDGQLSAEDDRKWKEKIDAESVTHKPQTASSGHVKRAPDTPVSMSATSPNESSRPSRRGVKRRYNDESFEGYTESFADDTVDAGSPDAGDDADAGSTARRKKRRVGRPSKHESSPATPSSAVRLRLTRDSSERG